MSFGSNPAPVMLPPPTPLAPPPPPMFGENPTGSKPKPKSQQPTFLGSTALPMPQQQQTKTLLGQ